MDSYHDLRDYLARKARSTNTTLEPEKHMTQKFTADDIGPYITNKANAMQLIEWLSEGAPHVAFNISFGSVNESEHGFDDAVDTTDAAGPQCGTVCCIAGAADQMQHGVFGKHIFDSNRGWDSLQAGAFEFLGMPADFFGEHPSDQHMWALFDPDAWSEDPTGEMAAAALVYYSNTGDAWKAINDAQGHYSKD